MSNDATAWQSRLEEHFAKSSLRSEQSGRPIFAIEHGLEIEEIESLKSVVRKSIKAEGLNPDFWLLWVVYAAEHGYAFDGIEFWEGFGERTQGWHAAGDRKQIRDWFRRFGAQYRGISPSGRWANHFSIISWPITHAILPKDLQRRLAKALYEAQYELQRVADRPTAEIGRTLSRAIQQSSQRFRLFLEQEEMLGQIVISLLGTPEEAAAGIDSMTLVRISRDLNSMRDAQDWVRQAQKTWRAASPQFKIVNPINSAAEKLKDQAAEDDRASKLISLIPVLEAQQVGGGQWQFELTVPSFNDVASLNIDFFKFLHDTRIAIPHAETRMRPGEWLLIGARKCILKTWPANGEGLLKFEKEPPFDKMMDWNLALPNKKVWTFKIQSDGTAKLITADCLQARNSYLIASPKEIDLSAFAEPCITSCQGLSVWRIDLPAIISSNLQSFLELLGLKCKKMLTLSASGIPPLQWLADFGGTWLSSSRPMLSIARDHQFDGYQFCLNGGEKIDAAIDSDRAIFIELPQLRSGQHTLKIRTYKLVGSEAFPTKEIQAEQDFQISIRDPKPWIAGESNSPAIFATVSPLAPSIEDFLTEGLGLEVLGDNNLTSKISIVLKDLHGIQLFRSVILEHSLPISSGIWANHYQSFLRSHSSNQRFHECGAAFLEISSPEFGNYQINLDRQFAPLRWMLIHKNSVPLMRLVEHDASEDTTATFCDYKMAMQDIPIKHSDSRGNLTVLANSGLYRASSGSFSEDVIYAPNDIHGSLTHLTAPLSPDSISALDDYPFILKRAAIWHNATPITYLAKNWQTKLVRMLYQRIIARFCGKKWLVAEKKLHDEPGEQFNWEALESLVTMPANFGIAVGKIQITADSLIPDIKSGLEVTIEKYKLSPVSKEALKIAWDIAWFDYHFQPIAAAECDVALHYGTAIRAARLLRLRHTYHRYSSTKDRR